MRGSRLSEEADMAGRTRFSAYLWAATALASLHLIVAVHAQTDEVSAKFNPGHYVAVGPGAAMDEISHLDEPAVRGVNKRYKWKRLEPRRGEYDFSEVEQDLAYLAARDKQLVVFIIDKSFSKYPSLPTYLSEYAVEADGSLDPVRWHPVMVERLVALGQALAARFDDDPHFEGVALQESALDLTEEAAAAHAYTPEKYRDSLIAILTGIQSSMKRSHVFWYCNFMQGDDGHLRQVAEAIVPYGVFMGGPDILPYRIGLREMNYPMYDEFEGRLTLFCSAQHDSYCHHKNDTRVWRKEPVHEDGYLTMEEIFLFARDSLHVSYIFWDEKYGGEDEGERNYDDAIEVIRRHPTFNVPGAAGALEERSEQ
jgi:hypothetical protein